MSKFNVSKFIKSVGSVVTKHSPEILTGIGIAGMVTTAVLAVKATPKALEKIEEKKREVYDDIPPFETPSQAIPEDVKLTPKEVVQATWKCYIPAAVTCVASAACLIGASRVSLKRNAALATAYNLSQTALAEYHHAVEEEVGEEKAKEIQTKAKRNVTEKITSNEGNTVFISSTQTFDCIDAYGRQTFKSNELLIREALVRFNNRLRDEMTLSLNDFYDELGLDHTPLGDGVGWYVNKCDVVQPSFDSMIINGVPYIVVDFLVGPTRDYEDYR